MVKRDLRKSGIAVQQDIRVKVLAALDGGMRKKDVMNLYGISDAAIYKWLDVRRKRGEEGLIQKKRGRPSRIKLTKAQQREVKNVIYTNCPDQVNLPFSLWTRDAVRDLLKNKFEVAVSRWTIDRYLCSWGIIPQKMICKAYTAHCREVEKWMKVKMPDIKVQAKTESAEILWLDEMGNRSDHKAWPNIKVTTETEKGTTAVKQKQLKMIFTLTNQRQLKYMFYSDRFTAKVCIDFMSRLIRIHRSKVFILVDLHEIFNSAEVRDWISLHTADIRLFMYPGYRLDLR